MTRDRFETQALRVLRWVGVAFFVAITAFPFYYMLLLSVRTIDEVIQSPGSLLVPLKDITLDAFDEVLSPVDEETGTGQGFLRFLLNSTVIALGTVAVALAAAVPGAYAISRLRFFGRRPIHFLFLAVYLFPTIVLAIPLFVVFSRAGMRGTLAVLIVVYVAQTLPVTVYMLKNYFDTVPRSLEEAAAVDGCSRMGVIWRISLPLSKPALMATGLYVFMIAWNEFLYALLFLLEKRDNWTVSLGVSQLQTIEVPSTVLMAGSVILTIPVIVLFFFAERLLVAGLTAGAEKG
jgi:multiple sugar transport system permease protein